MILSQMTCDAMQEPRGLYRTNIKRPHGVIMTLSKMVTVGIGCQDCRCPCTQ